MRLLIAVAAVAMVASEARAQECFPECREGYTKLGTSVRIAL